jgi:hypothetical protein
MCVHSNVRDAYLEPNLGWIESAFEVERMAKLRRLLHCWFPEPAIRNWQPYTHTNGSAQRESDHDTVEHPHLGC